MLPLSFKPMYTLGSYIDMVVDRKVQPSFYAMAAIMRGGCRKSRIVNVTFCESFAKVSRELRKSGGWDLNGRALSSSQVPHFHTYSLPLKLSDSHSLNRSPHSVTLPQSLSLSLSLSLSHSLSLSLSLTLSLLLSVCLSLSLSLSLSFSLAK